MKPNSPSVKNTVSPLNFFALTFFLSWLIWIPLVLSHFGVIFNIPESTCAIVRLLGVLMPAVSAIILTIFTGGYDGMRNIWARLILWQVSWKWWLAAVAAQPALLVLAVLINNRISDSKVSPVLVGSTGALIINVVMLLIASLGEEIGWRGVALPGLQEKNSALKSSLILGLLWATWHIPFWLLLDTFDQFGMGYLFLNFLFVLPFTIYITWIFNHSQQSILLVVMIHVTFNIVNTALLPITLNINAFLIFGVLEWAVTPLIIRHLEADKKPFDLIFKQRIP